AQQHPVSDDHLLAYLSELDTIFVIDPSSMLETQSALQTLLTLLPDFMPHNENGFCTSFLKLPCELHENIKDENKIKDIFKTVRPASMTHTGLQPETGPQLKEILINYLEKHERNCSTKPIDIIVVTDEMPAKDADDIVKEITNRRRKLKAPTTQVAVRFFQ
ncbi:hypothetical protein J3E72DRAFT_162394, partial [Bipolaris maydis]